MTTPAKKEPPTRQRALRWTLCALLFCVCLSPHFLYGQLLTTDQWHTVESDPLDDVQLRPVAVLNENDEATAWRVELRVPFRYGQTLQDGTPLYLLMEDGSDVAPSIEISDGEEGELTEVRVPLSDETVRALAEAPSARFIGGDAQIDIPMAFRADLRRMRAKAPTAPSETSSRQSSSEAGEATEDEVFMMVEEQPRLIGGMKRLQELVQYPSSAKEKDLEGRVFVQFIVDKSGRVIDPTVTRGVHPTLDSAAVRAVEQIGFEPGRQRGEIVKVQMSLPVTFRSQ